MEASRNPAGDQVTDDKKDVATYGDLIRRLRMHETNRLAAHNSWLQENRAVLRLRQQATDFLADKLSPPEINKRHRATGYGKAFKTLNHLAQSRNGEGFHYSEAMEVGKLSRAAVLVAAKRMVDQETLIQLGGGRYRGVNSSRPPSSSMRG